MLETYQITSAYQLWSFITRPSDVMVNIAQMPATETQLVILVFENVHQSCILQSRAVDIPQILIFLKVLVLFLKKLSHMHTIDASDTLQTPIMCNLQSLDSQLI